MSKIPENYLPDKNTWPQYLTPDEFADTPYKLNLADYLLDRHVAAGRGDNVAIRFMEKVITYSQLQKMVNQFGNALKGAGVEPQDRVGIRLVNAPMSLVTIFAIEKIGAIPVPTSPLWSREEISFVVNNAEMKYFVVNAPLMEQVEAAKPGFTCGAKVVVIGGVAGDVKSAGNLVFEEMIAGGSPELEAVMLDPFDIGVILYTSGTTGMPKGCVHFVRPTVIETRMVNKYVYQLKPGDILGGAAPVSFAAGFGTFTLIPFEGGAGISLLPKFSPPDMMELIGKHNITVLTGLPTAYRALLKFAAFTKYDIGSVRLFTAGGDALGAETLNGWRELTGSPIWEGLGGTEMLHLVTSNTLNEQPAPNSIGKPLPGVDVRVIDLFGERCKAGEVGSMIVRGPSGTLYWKPCENDEKLLRAQKSGVVDGWNKMGDAVYMAEDGNIFFVAREDDMIKSSGYRISPAEIEEAMAKHPAIADVGVVGIPEPEKGQIVKAVVELQPGVTGSKELTEEIVTFLKDYVALYKLPRIVQYIDKLPRTPTGKLVRRLLR
ncbi:MAG: acyl-CoA synthetase [Syntrophobacteraceae bacterium]|nr:acyl-CoA synthetase [Syntrophobacteraceae bacterium]